ncbi:TetR/AcrR family transcriptional regulator [Caldalkalibacillus mannanilyticus]|uniref:TetR/AcrR family transcriptional regulator n=1 Tax=Caldalkalibacillus mannanilyticus TaxID=1418 RepID=UPI0004682C62|nr:TetR/AcrR family transcriptional regulator [Caldalkalibacillus mannanilyticus]
MNTKTYQESKLQHTENLRNIIVEAAAKILQDHGPEAVTIRRVAEKMECSTKIIYNLFNNKDGLIKLLYLEGCKILAKNFESVVRQENIEQNLRELCEAYWDFGQNYTNYYKLMFGGAFSEFKPEEESLNATITALQQFITLIAEAIEAGQIIEQDPVLVVHVVWASLHGVIHLHLGGHIENVEAAKALYEKSVTNLIHTYLRN